jgi:hypothetical protein
MDNSNNNIIGPMSTESIPINSSLEYYCKNIPIKILELIFILIATTLFIICLEEKPFLISVSLMIILGYIIFTQPEIKWYMYCSIGMLIFFIEIILHKTMKKYNMPPLWYPFFISIISFYGVTIINEANKLSTM